MNTRIKQIRTEAKMNQRDFGERIGITNAAVTKLENGTNNPSEQTVRAICQEFKINREWLLEGKGEMREQGDLFSIRIRNLIPNASDQVVDFFKALTETPNGLDTIIEVCQRYHEIAKEKEGHE